MDSNISLNLYTDDLRTPLGTLELTDHSEFPLALTWSTGDFTDVTKRSGAFSKSFKLPATKHNNQVLGYIYQMAVPLADDLLKCRAQVLVSGIPMFDGTLKIKQISQAGRGPESYELELTGENLDWVDKFKESSIRDIDYGNRQCRYFANDYDEMIGQKSLLNANSGLHEFNEAAVIASWQNFPNLFDYVYSLKSYGAWINGGRVVTDDMRPDVSIRHILIQAFLKAGYRVQSTFLNSDFFKKLVLVFTGNGFRYDADAKARMLFKANLCGIKKIVANNSNHTFSYLFNLPDCGDAFDSGNNYDGTYYTLPVGRRQKFKVIGQVTLTNWHQNLNYIMVAICKVHNGTTTVLSSTVKTFGGNGETADIDLDTGSRYFNQGDKICVYLFYQTNGFILASRAPKFEFSLLEFFNEAPDNIIEHDYYAVKDVLPDIKQIDVLTGVMNMFNLYFKTDTITKVVYCEPRDQFLKPISQAIDWTSKLDIGKDAAIEYLDDYKRELVFKYKADGKDAILKDYTEVNKLYPGSLEHSLSDKFDPGKQELGSKVFSYTDIFQDWTLYDRNISIFSAPQIPRFWKSLTPTPEASYEFDPRIMVYEGYDFKLLPNGSGIPKKTAWIFGNPQLLRNKYPILGNVQLDFAGSAGLVNNYYLNTISQIEDGRQLIVYFKLGLTDIINLDLRVPIYLLHPTLSGYYYIASISDYRPATMATTKAVLLPLPAKKVVIDLDNRVDTTAQRLAPTIGRATGSVSRFGNEVLSTNPLTPSAVLNNGTGNWAVENVGAIAIGQGVIANGINQTVLGAYNVVSADDVIQIGGGTSNTDRYRALTFTQDGNFLVQGGYLYTSDGREIMFASQRTPQGQAKRFDKLHLTGNE